MEVSSWKGWSIPLAGLGLSLAPHLCNSTPPKSGGVWLLREHKDYVFIFWNSRRPERWFLDGLRIMQVSLGSSLESLSASMKRLNSEGRNGFGRGRGSLRTFSGLRQQALSRFLLEV